MRQEPSEAELVELARRGDGDAYVALLRLHESVAYRTAYVILGSADGAEDATQEAFVKAHGALNRFETGRPFRPWLLRIVANEARNYRRSTWRRGALASRAVEAEFDSTARSAEADVLAAEDRAHLLEAIGRLPDGDRMAIVGRYILELSDEEAAAVLGIKPVAVRVRVWRALGKLRRELGEEVA
ncbi:MAG: RNA polymerase sigma factor [Gaiellaceae bacterium]